MATWREWLTQRNLQDLLPLPTAVLDREWDPTEEDRNAAWDLYTQLRTRITTQPLHYRAGDEGTALESVHQLFGVTRELIVKYKRSCVHFAILSVFMLNGPIRPFTARWHKRKEAGRLCNQDACGTFRQELQGLQAKLIGFQRLLGHLAEDAHFQEGSETGFQPGSVGHPIGNDVSPTSLLLINNPQIWDGERADILARRHTVLGQPNPATTNLIGVAISGGGIRSATFALGVVQRLAEQGFLPEVDYLSTVSGGGYLGSFLSSYLNSNNVDVGPGAAQQPFVRPHQTESAAIRHLRNHTKYLIEGTRFDRFRAIAQAIYGVAANLLVVSALSLLLAIVTVLTVGFRIQGALTSADPFQFSAPVAIGVLFVGVPMALLWLGLPIVQMAARLGPRRSRFRDRYERLAAATLALALFAALLVLLPALVAGLDWLDKHVAEGFRFLPLISPPLLGILLAAARQIGSWSGWLVRLFWVAGPLLCVLFYLSATRAVVLAWLENPDILGWWQWWPPIPGVPGWFLVLVAVDVVMIVYCFLFLNINMTSPQRYYRDQLAKTYLLKQPANQAPEVDDLQKLSGLGTQSKAPYHLINGTLNLSNSDQTDLRGRYCDFFLFSKHFCGSPILGYFPTAAWEDLDGYLNLGTAVAISGAAAAPVMGVTSIFGANFQLAMLNVRLAYWLSDPNPAKQFKNGPWPSWWRWPGPRYLLWEMLGWTDEKTPYVNVSDGGHLENLAIYELLRRRCKFIVAIDGECDPLMTCRGLTQVMRFAKIDFGIEIAIDVGELRLDDTGFSKAHYALGTMNYGGGDRGYLLYIKSSLTGNESPYVLTYKDKAPAFPHESTANQLYNEDQFEAYRALGHHAADDLFRSELLVDPPGPPATVRDWFQKLANSLLG